MWWGRGSKGKSGLCVLYVYGEDKRAGDERNIGS
jgi:hypothetical protein